MSPITKQKIIKQDENDNFSLKTSRMHEISFHLSTNALIINTNEPYCIKLPTEVKDAFQSLLADQLKDKSLHLQVLHHPTTER